MIPYLGWQQGMADRAAFLDVVGPELHACAGMLIGSTLNNKLVPAALRNVERFILEVSNKSVSRSVATMRL